MVIIFTLENKYLNKAPTGAAHVQKNGYKCIKAQMYGVDVINSSYQRVLESKELTNE